MSTIRDIKSKLTQKALDALCTKYHIPTCVHATLPGPNQSILQSSDGKIGVYTRFFNFANYQIPLSQFLVDVLAHFRIHLSQLSVFGVAKVSHFEILCRVHDFQPSVNCFRHTVSLNPPASAALRGSSDIIDKLFDEGDDAGQEHFVERDDDVPEETVAKDFSKIAVEKTKKKRKRKVVRDASGSTFPPKKLREDYHAATSNIGGKSLAAIRDLVPDGFSVLSRVAEPHVVVSVTPTPDDGSTDSVSPAADVPVTTVAVPLPSLWMLLLFRLPMLGLSKKILKILRILPLLARLMRILLNMANDFVLDDPYVYRDLTDRLASPALFSQLQTMDYDQLYTEFNVGATRQVCLGAKVRMRAEHTLEQKDRFEDKCSEQTAFLSERDAEIAHLKDLKERNFVLEGEKDALSEKVMTLESISALKETELAYLTAQVTQLTSELSGFQLSRDELSYKVASLESERDMLANQRSSLECAFKLFKGRMEAMQDEQATVLGNMAIGCAINKGIQDDLKAGVDHGKAGRDLSAIKAYDPSTEDKYIDSMNALGTVDFSLLSELKPKKDLTIVDLMDSLHLEGPLAEIPGAEDLQPSPAQLMLPIHRPEKNVVLGETSLSFSLQVIHSRVQMVKGEIKEKRLSLTDVIVPLAEPLSSKSLIGEASTSVALATAEPITTLSMTFASSGVVPPLSISDYQVLDTKPYDEDPPATT
ncbi:hypothetical protein Tco_0911811 [Tanacetum coccineum]